MKFDVLATAVAVGLGVSGCGLAQQAQLDKGKEELLAGQADCRARASELKTAVARASCVNEVEERVLVPLAGNSADLVRVKLATRMVLAEKVDRKELTESEAELEFAKQTSAVVSEDHRRSTASRAVGAQEAAAAAAGASRTCTRIGQTVTCY